MWGWNFEGGLGTANRTDSSSPVQTFAGGTNWKQVFCGGYHTAAIKMDGTLWMWGRNTEGELGTNNTTSYSIPVQTVSAGTNWKQVACGQFHTGAIKTDGTLWMWGNNSSGELGVNNVTARSSPVQTVSGGTNWKQVDCGYSHTGAIKTDGTLWMWGYNSYGQLGINDVTWRSSPIQTVAGGTNWKQVAAGDYSSIACKDDN
jgi:alpha-tubulin suppressor-like RCC1 family protein